METSIPESFWDLVKTQHRGIVVSAICYAATGTKKLLVSLFCLGCSGSRSTIMEMEWFKFRIYALHKIKTHIRDRHQI